MKRILPVLLATALIAQENKDLTIRTGVNIVVIPTTVTRGDGSYVNGLEPKDFKVYDNNKLQEIQQDVSFVPISMVVAVQRSAQTEKALPAVQKMGSLLEGAVLGENGEAAVIAFDHRIEKICDFTNDGIKLREALQKLKPGSRTNAMTDAVVESVRLLKTRPTNRRRILLLVSETKDYGSEAKLKEALTDVQLANVIVYPVNMSRWLNKLAVPDEAPRQSTIPPSARPFPPGAPQTPTTAAQLGVGGTFGSIIPAITEIFTATKAIFVDNPQEVYAKYTGGTEHGFVGLKGMEEAISKIGEELHSQYLLSYNPNNKEDGGYHIVQVIVTKPGYQVRARGGYWMASIPN